MKPSGQFLSRTGLDAPETNRSNSNKKELTLLFYCISLFCLFPVHAGQSESFLLSKQPTTTETLDLEGDLRTGGFRSSGDVITAELQDGVIMALFHKDVGNLLVTITDEAHGTVYETTVNTPVQHQLFIPLAGLPSGTYTIAFSNGRGEMWGEFEI